MHLAEGQRWAAPTKLAHLTEVDLLFIDDLGLRPLKGEEHIDLYEIIRLRYERASTIITSNRDTDELHPLFGDPGAVH